MEDDELMTVMHNTIPTVTKLYLPTNSYYKAPHVTVEDDELMTVMHNKIPTVTKLYLPTNSYIEHPMLLWKTTS